MKHPVIITPPGAEPVSIQEAKDQLRLEGALDDASLVTMIGAARRHIEKVCWRGLLVQTLELTLPGFYDSIPAWQAPPSWVMPYFNHTRPLRLPGGQLTATADLGPSPPTSPLLFVKYVDPAGSLLTLDPSAYEIDATEPTAKIRPVFGTSWPNTRDTWNAVQLRYMVGWSLETLPEELRQAMLILVSQLYEGREGESLGGAAFDALISPYRISRTLA